MSSASRAEGGPRLRPKLVAGGVAALVVLAAALVLLLRGGGGGQGSLPTDAAARLIPADALVYVHLSTDGTRGATRRAQRMAAAFPGYAAARRGLLARLSAPQCGVRLGRVKGTEAALALLDAGQGGASSLVLVDTGRDQSKAPVRTCRTVQVVGIGRFLVIGQPQSLALAQALAMGRGRPLADDPRYRAATAGLAPGRVLDGWVTAAGVRRLLAPQGGLLGAAGTLLDQPGLRGSAFALAAVDGGARVTVTSLLDGRRRGPTFRPFTPSLARDVPGDALAYLGLAGVSTASTRLLSASGAAGVSGLGGVLARVRAQLAPPSGGRLGRELAALFGHEVAVAITPAVPAPVLTVIARTPDPGATGRTLRRLQAPLARALATPGRPAPAWEAVRGAFRLAPAGGVELDYAVLGDTLVLSTRMAGIDAVRRPSVRLTVTADYRAVVGRTPGKAVSSLVFLDFSQLLRLGEQTGLNDSKTYLAAKDDLQRVRAIGARSSSDGRQSTAELFLTIP